MPVQRSLRSPSDRTVDLSSITAQLDDAGRAARDYHRKAAAQLLADQGAVQGAHAAAKGSPLPQKSGLSPLIDIYNKAASETFLVKTSVEFEHWVSSRETQAKDSDVFDRDAAGNIIIDEETGRPRIIDRASEFLDNALKQRATRIAALEADPNTAPLAAGFAATSLRAINQAVTSIQEDSITKDLQSIQLQAETVAKDLADSAADQMLREFNSNFIAEDPKQAEELLDARLKATEATIDALLGQWPGNAALQRRRDQLKDRVAEDLLARAAQELPMQGIAGIKKYNALVQYVLDGGWFDDNQQPRILRMQDQVNKAMSGRVSSLLDRKIQSFENPAQSAAAEIPLGNKLSDVLGSKGGLWTPHKTAIELLNSGVLDDTQEQKANYILWREAFYSHYVLNRRLPESSPYYGRESELMKPGPFRGAELDNQRKEIERWQEYKANPDKLARDMYDYSTYITPEGHPMSAGNLLRAGELATQGATADQALRQRYLDAINGPNIKAEEIDGTKTRNLPPSTGTIQGFSTAVTTLIDKMRTASRDQIPALQNQLSKHVRYMREALEDTGATVHIGEFNQFVTEGGLSRDTAMLLNLFSDFERTQGVDPSLNQAAATMMAYAVDPRDYRTIMQDLPDADDLGVTESIRQIKVAAADAYATMNYGSKVGNVALGDLAAKMYVLGEINGDQNSFDRVVDMLSSISEGTDETRLDIDYRDGSSARIVWDPGWDSTLKSGVQELTAVGAMPWMPPGQQARLSTGQNKVAWVPNGDDLIMMEVDPLGNMQPVQLGMDVADNQILTAADAPIYGDRLRYRRQGMPVVIRAKQ